MDTLKSIVVLVGLLILAVVATSIGAFFSVLGLILATLMKFLVIGAIVGIGIAYFIWSCCSKKSARNPSSDTMPHQ